MSGDACREPVQVYEQWCREHRAQEAQDGSYVHRVCRECGHASPTPDILETEFAETTGRTAHTPHHLIRFCPACLTEYPDASR